MIPHPAARSLGVPALAGGRQGNALIVALFMLVAVLMLGISAASNALQGERAARADRDRQVALQAAEAALLDAELDIEQSPDPGRSRSHIFHRRSSEGFAAGCAAAANVYLGLCRSAEGQAPAWQTVDFLEAGDAAASVEYGRFTGRHFATGKGALSARPPRYIIELMPFKAAGTGAGLEERSFFYRITAVGFGAQESTQVVLQTVYRKALP